MKTLAETIIPEFAQCLQDGIDHAPKGTKYIAVHVSSGHMSIFWEAYANLRDVEKAIAQPLLDPQCYSEVKLVWDVEGEHLVFYSSMGFVESAHEYWEENKNNPDAIEAVCVGNVKDILDPKPTHPNVKSDHFCQADPGTTVCYFCGGPVQPVDITKATLHVALNKPDKI